MRAFSKGCETDFLLKSWDLKCMGMVLMCISSILADKSIVCCLEPILASIIGKVKFLQVINKHIFRDISNSFEIATLIMALIGRELLPGRMRHDLPSTSSSFMICMSLIMIALNPKLKVPLCIYHRIIDLFILIKFFQVGNIASDRTTANHNYQIN